MKKYSKSILSLFLAFTLIPAIPFNVANATEPHKIPLGEVELAVGEEKPLGTCLIKADSAYLSAEPATCCFSVTSPGMSMGCIHQSDDENGNANSPLPLITPAQPLTFSIVNQGATSNTFDATLTIETGSNGCYDCTLADGDKVSFGDCSTDNNNGGSSTTSEFMSVTLQPGEESRVGQHLYNGEIKTACDVDATSGSVQYKVNALKDTTKFTMFMKEKDKMIAEKSFTGAGALDFDSREYETVTFGVKNDAQESDTFKSYLQATNSKSTQPFVCNAASRILAPIAALLGGLLLLF